MNDQAPDHLIVAIAVGTQSCLMCREGFKVEDAFPDNGGIWTWACGNCDLPHFAHDACLNPMQKQALNEGAREAALAAIAAQN